MPRSDYAANIPRPTRRQALAFGTASLFGLSLADLLRGRLRANSRAPNEVSSFGRAKSCILIWLKGGPSHLDTFDLKPDAPVEIRGEFRPIDTVVPGMRFAEHLPRLARQADKLLVVRSMSHTDTGHPSGAYQMTTGREYPRAQNLADNSTREDHPHLGSSVAAVARPLCPAPPYVLVPQYLIVNGQFRSGQNAGALGRRFDPLVPGGDPNSEDFRPKDLGLAATVDREQILARRALLTSLNEVRADLRRDPSIIDFNGCHAQAFNLLAGGTSRQAFDIAAEPATLRDRYGRTQLGQSTLLARRLIEAGVGLVHVNCMSSILEPNCTWDSHKDNFNILKDHRLPPADAAIAALLEELHQRGMLDETLVVVAGEFGRTPKVNSGAGRDHWPNAFTVLLAGAGLPGGTYYGATDKYGAYPSERPISPARLAATIFHALGIDPSTELTVSAGRRWRLADEPPALEMWA
ncbi:MAG TPA: DUF1501 domain-containing protein [Pirellulales bacterium]|nr:DUF1501 domain-containing protein [Pirellulales bacterium]